MSDRGFVPPTSPAGGSHPSRALSGWASLVEDGGPGAVCERLSLRALGYGRYRIGPEIARGGMGRILEVWDEDLHRHVAMKTLAGSPAEDASAASGERRLARFLEEARITGQLDHPGIVPVHELGVDPRGRAYFTLKLVQGRELSQVYELAREEREGWSQTRVLGVLLRVCEAMAFAHERGVIHRDLKPGNVMVGRHGETYVMDWGLARVLAEEEVAAGGSAPTQAPRSRADDDTTPYHTREGDVLGTPQYMPPEQARGERERIGPAADVYAVGAMLYELLAGVAPYLHGLRRPDPRRILLRVGQTAPEPLASIRPGHPAELVAICEKAMAREPSQRYPDMVRMAEDLRAYLENRVVRAHRTGPWVELRKWVQRNRWVALLLLALALTITSAGFAAAWFERARQSERVDRLAAAYVGEWRSSWRIHPSSLPEIERWIAGVRELEPALRERERELGRLREHGHPAAWTSGPPELESLEAAIREQRWTLEDHGERLRWAKQVLAGEVDQDDPDEEPEQAAARAEADLELLPLEMGRIQAELPRLEARREHLLPWKLEDPLQQLRQDRMARVVNDLRSLLDPVYGCLPSVEELATQARDLRRRTVEDHASEWQTAIDSIRDSKECRLYDGLVIAPQTGLIPLRRDAVSGLWEFWHVLSGERPACHGESSYKITEASGIVLVLVPGGKVWIGAQSEDPARPNYDQSKMPFQGPGYHELFLAPYFLSKYELTQAQYERLGGGRPSSLGVGFTMPGVPAIRAVHPVEKVDRDRAQELLRRVDLDLPSGAQWERAARAGEVLAYGAYAAFEKLPPGINLADETYHVAMGGGSNIVYVRGKDDGYAFTAPVDCNESNPWGLIGMYGNIAEWTSDRSNIYDVGDAESEARIEFREATGERIPPFGRMQTYRGGCYKYGKELFRPTLRFVIEAGTVRDIIGLRPARALE